MESYDRFNAYLAITDEFPYYIWVFLIKSKEPPIDITNVFPAQFGNDSGGLIRIDQRGELAGSNVEEEIHL